MKWSIERKKNQVMFVIVGKWGNLETLKKYHQFFQTKIQEYKVKQDKMEEIIDKSYIESIKVLAHNELKKVDKKLKDVKEFFNFITSKMSELEKNE